MDSDFVDIIDEHLDDMFVSCRDFDKLNDKFKQSQLDILSLRGELAKRDNEISMLRSKIARYEKSMSRSSSYPEITITNRNTDTCSLPDLSLQHRTERITAVSPDDFNYPTHHVFTRNN